VAEDIDGEDKRMGCSSGEKKEKWRSALHGLSNGMGYWAVQLCFLLVKGAVIYR
jgi:hypothetical protein